LPRPYCCLLVPLITSDPPKTLDFLPKPCIKEVALLG